MPRKRLKSLLEQNNDTLPDGDKVRVLSTMMDVWPDLAVGRFLAAVATPDETASDRAGSARRTAT